MQNHQNYESQEKDQKLSAHRVPEGDVSWKSDAGIEQGQSVTAEKNEMKRVQFNLLMI